MIGHPAALRQILKSGTTQQYFFSTTLYVQDDLTGLNTGDGKKLRNRPTDTARSFTILGYCFFSFSGFNPVRSHRMLSLRRLIRCSAPKELTIA